MDSFYRRALPPPCVAFASPEGRHLFREALAEGTMEGFFPLAEQFHTQAEPAFCGLGTLVVVLNAMAIDPGREWRGPWRWFGEEMLDCCRPLDAVRREGLTLDQLACLARCNGAAVSVHRGDALDLAGLRELVLAAATSPEGPYLVAGYARRTLGQTGDGHYSPIGGYHRGRDLALVLDVARFKYPPHWVPIELLHTALQPRDAATDRPRGCLVLRRRHRVATSICTVVGDSETFRATAEALACSLPERLAADAPEGPEQVVAAFLRRGGPVLGALVAVRGADDDRAALWAELRDLPLRAHVARALAREPGLAAPVERAAELLTLVLLAVPDEVFGRLGPELRGALARLRERADLPARLRDEVEHLADQIAALRERACEQRTCAA